jgi:hypothetical protein
VRVVAADALTTTTSAIAMVMRNVFTFLLPCLSAHSELG